MLPHDSIHNPSSAGEWLAWDSEGCCPSKPSLGKLEWCSWICKPSYLCATSLLNAVRQSLKACKASMLRFCSLTLVEYSLPSCTPKRDQIGKSTILGQEKLYTQQEGVQTSSASGNEQTLQDALELLMTLLCAIIHQKSSLTTANNMVKHALTLIAARPNCCSKLAFRVLISARKASCSSAASAAFATELSSQLNTFLAPLPVGQDITLKRKVTQTKFTAISGAPPCMSPQRIRIPPDKACSMLYTKMVSYMPTLALLWHCSQSSGRHVKWSELGDHCYSAVTM